MNIYDKLFTTSDMAFQLKTDAPSNIIFTTKMNGEAVGRLYLSESGELVFEGNAHESAIAFFEAMKPTLEGMIAQHGWKTTASDYEVGAFVDVNDVANLPQFEPVALPKRNQVTVSRPVILDGTEMVQVWNACIEQMEKLGPLYTHADPNVRWQAVAGEQMKIIEQLRAELGEAKGEYDRSANLIAQLQADLTARDERIDTLVDDLEQAQYDKDAWKNDKESLWVQVFHGEGDDPFISAVSGAICIEQLTLIQEEIVTGAEDLLESGPGFYVLRCRHHEAHYDNVGMTEPAHWEIDFESYSRFPWADEAEAMVKEAQPDYPECPTHAPDKPCPGCGTPGYTATCDKCIPY